MALYRLALLLLAALACDKPSATARPLPSPPAVFERAGIADTMPCAPRPVYRRGNVIRGVVLVRERTQLDVTELLQSGAFGAPYRFRVSRCLPVEWQSGAPTTLDSVVLGHFVEVWMSELARPTIPVTAEATGLVVWRNAPSPRR